MNLQALVPGILALAVVLACARLLLRQWRAAPAARARAWRLALLLALQPVAAWLLYRTLLPPELPTRAGTMTVLTAGATRAQLDSAPRGEVLVALPEAPQLADASRVPDLGTALRLHPGTARLQVVGAGLPARDRQAVGTLALTFEPPPARPGVAELWAPARIAPGASFRIAGRVDGAAGGAVELLDPAGRRIGLARPEEYGRFVVSGTARAAGTAPFALRVRDADRATLEEFAVPLWVEPQSPPRVLMLAGAPNPEFKFLRRWTADAGLPAHVRIEVGGGVALGDAPLALDPAQLREFDLVVLDERAWAGLGQARRARLAEAVREGLGLLLRVTGPLQESTRRQLGTLGFEPSAGATTAELALAGANAGGADERPDPGAAEDAPVPAGEAVPTLLRRDLDFGAADAAQAGPASADWLRWRAYGRGRVALATLVDSWRLVLAGQEALHAALWSEAFAVVARPDAAAAPRVGPHPRAGERVAICGVADGAQVLAPDGEEATLLPDSAAGTDRCAGYWPRASGWHLVRQGERTWPFHVLAAEAAPGLAAAALREGTLALVGGGMRPAGAAVTGQPRRGRSWPWLLGWLGAVALLWWLERVPAGRRHAAPGTSTPARAALG
ncbi:carboxypeptidase regulatory-like domain-containing protein [Luteimonas sp. RD2P54]|uniref:Carboxypeptidase regulatory-like domain-containing protein n=1 Tax=Luteimonas endophytica TaxID=3042023 RepID=A0ABT6JC94_9GAMM|nr:carboxypeptidase regulatory-like domain-containing protein [Luteimonas endophytica]MDH5824432.1 carboxypeptidase regulatory-like domain-containing protein [Luteimonas endophytica]